MLYVQSAQSMKSLLQAAWLLTISIGDSIIIVIADVQFFPDLVGLLPLECVLSSVLYCVHVNADM